MVGLVLWRVWGGTYPPEYICRAAGDQCVVELGLFRLAPRRTGIHRHPATVGVDRGHRGDLLARQTTGRRLAHAVPAMDELCRGVELSGLATQSSAAGFMTRRRVRVSCDSRVAMVPNKTVQPMRSRARLSRAVRRQR